MADARSGLVTTPAASRVAGAGAPPSVVEVAVIGFVIVAGLYLGQAVLVPLALAVILSFVLAPGVRVLRRLGLPNAPSVFFIVVLAFAVIFGVGTLITQQVGSLAQELPRYQLTLQDKVKALKVFAADSGGAIERASATLKNLQEELEKPEAGSAPSPPPTAATPNAGGLVGEDGRRVPVEVYPPNPTPLDQLQDIIGVIIAPLATAGITILFVIFLLIQRIDVRDRAIRLLGSHDLERSTAAMDDAGQRLSRYFLTMTLINSVYGVAIGCALWLIGIPNPILWGVLAMLMRFVPFLGSFIAAAFPLLLAAAVDQGWSMFLMTLALYVVGEIVMGNLIEPVVQGNRTGLSPLAIILSAAFWTLLWGPIGLLLAIPLTVVLVVLGRHVERLTFLHVLLGDSPPLSPPEHFYQRMLAGDPAEPVEQAEQFIKERPLVDYYDEVMVEGLRLAQADADRGTLDAERLTDIREAAEVVVEAFSDNDLVPRSKTKPAAKPGNGTEDAPAAAGEEAADSGADETRAFCAAIDAGRIGQDWRNENAVLCIASRTALDETAALVLAQLLSKCGLGAKALGPSDTKLGVLRNVAVEDVRLICVSALDVSERSAHVRFLTRRLKSSVPDAVLLGGFWKLDPNASRSKEIIDSVPADQVVHTLKDALAYCLQAASAAPEGEAGRASGEQPEMPNPIASATPIS